VSIDNGSSYINIQCFELALTLVCPISRWSLITRDFAAQCLMFTYNMIYYYCIRTDQTRNSWIDYTDYWIVK